MGWLVDDIEFLSLPLSFGLQPSVGLITIHRTFKEPQKKMFNSSE